MHPGSKALFYRQMAQLVGSGFHLDRSIDLLSSQSNDSAMRRLLEAIKTGLLENRTLSEAMAHHAAEETSELERLLIQTGERSGQLESSLNHLHEYFESAQRSQRTARNSLIYPLILAHAAIAVPALSQYLHGAISGEATPILPALILRAVALWAVFFAGYWGWKRLAEAAPHSMVADQFIRRLPIIGNVHAQWSLSRFCQVLHSALLAAMRTSEGLRLAGRAAQSAVLHTAAEQTAKTIEAGGTLTQGIRSAGGFPPEFVSSLHSAEAVGTLDLECQRWATYATENAREAQSRASELLPKIAYMIVAAYLAWTTISFFAGYYGDILRMSSGY